MDKLIDKFTKWTYNIIMFSDDNYTTYEELGIFELRQLGRELGVYSPTLLKNPN